jgi:hypothetical protein
MIERGDADEINGFLRETLRIVVEKVERPGRGAEKLASDSGRAGCAARTVQGPLLGSRPRGWR